MNQGSRPLRGLAAAALVAAVLVPPAHAVPGGDPRLAGSTAGQGRERPGRPVTEPANPDAVLAARPLPARPLPDGPAQVPARPEHPAHPDRPARPDLPVPDRPALPPPGRPVPERPRPVPVLPPPEIATPSRPPAPSPPPAALGTPINDRAADLAAHILPLGAGIALMGLGLGFLAVRLRRG
ncbi:hypothetical protein [Streptomyces sp. NPDC090022]|uniref:hypothetical protein n=1 Tax=Streptomyces sp. NPDC090022 TaxID=3365920 RepID=UPI003818F569